MPSLSTALAIGFAALFAPLALFYPQQSSGSAIVLVLVLLAAVLIRRVAPDRDAMWAGWRQDWPVWALIGFLGLSAIWAADPGQALKKTLQVAALTGVAFCFWRFPRRLGGVADSVLWTMVGAFACLCLFMAIETHTRWVSSTVFVENVKWEASQFRNQPSVYIALMVWPAVLALTFLQQRLLAALLLLASIAALTGTTNASAYLALLCGGLTYALAHWRPRLPHALLVVGGLSVFVILPLAVSDISVMSAIVQWVSENKTLFSAAHRAGIWHFTTQEFLMAPILGHGMDSARDLADGLTMQDISSFAPALEQMKWQDLASASALPLHPHNLQLLLLVELGLVGAAAFSLVLIRQSIRLLAGTALHAHPCLIGWMTSWLVLAMLNVGFWKSWWLALCALTLLQFALILNAKRTRSPA